MKYIVSLNGKDYEVEVERGQAVMLNVTQSPAPVAAPVAPAPVPAAPAAVAAPAAAPAPAAPVAGGEVVVAPMPGLILNVVAKPGAQVKAGDTVVTLEAMKMENEISAPCDGVVGQILVAKGANVDTGEPLFTMV
ncbi:MAG: acetyl-CoA carboxylase biotin carboxyl carrier protein subunit [Eubacteriales bacterium]|nr:acetyl-CoA carboxylase biotin carboxyl carrier protein subunit [Eubacteriales bacterium]